MLRPTKIADTIVFALAIVLPAFGLAQGPVFTSSMSDTLSFDANQSMSFLKTGSISCQDDNGKAFNPSAHFISHVLAAGGIRIANQDSQCESGCCNDGEQLASAFANAAIRFSNVREVALENARAGDFAVQFKNVNANDSFFVFAERPNDGDARTYRHDSIDGSQRVAIAQDRFKVYRIQNANQIDIAKLEKQLTRHEGKRNLVYKDTVGIPTIGIGFNLTRPDAKEKIEAVGANYQRILDGSDELTDLQVSQLFQEDIVASVLAGRSIVSNFDELNDVRKRVIVDMTFNLGQAGLKKFRNLRSAVEANNFGIAGDEMIDSIWYRQVKTRGKTLVAMMKTGRDPEWLR